MRHFPKISKFWVFIFMMCFVRGVLANHYRIPSESMLPTLEIGDDVLVLRRAYDHAAPQRGQVMVFEDVHDPRTLLIKRLIAIPGDHVEIVDDKLIINGEAATYENLHDVGQTTLLRECLLGDCREIYRIRGITHPDVAFVVPKDHFFMMGDNRDNSNDSRYWGFLPRENIVGLASRVLWNLRLAGVVPTGDLSRVGQKL
ncbi:MAG: signal peptidase I [Bdellovibrionota bacterium]